eukprot:952823-Prymnesium_polylepis.1
MSAEHTHGLRVAVFPLGESERVCERDGAVLSVAAVNEEASAPRVEEWGRVRAATVAATRATAATAAAAPVAAAAAAT